MATRLTGLASGMDTETLIQGMMDAHRLKNKKTTDKQVKLTWQQDKWKELNTKLYKLYTEDLSKMRLQGNYQTKKVTSSNDNLVSVTGSANATEGAHTLKINNLATSQYVTGGSITEDGLGNPITVTATTKLSDLGVKAGTIINIGSAPALTVDDSTTIADFVKNAKEAGLNASFDESQSRFFISSKESGIDNGFQITATDADVGTVDANILNHLGLDNITLDTNGEIVTPAIAFSTIVAASDSEIIYNGAKLTGSSNVITANGLTISLKGETVGTETISLNITNDTKANYDMVKSFIGSYNDILKEMNTLYYANSTRGYNPLSDDEKEAMTDDQIATWETKIKDSVLRRDPTMGSLLDSMKSAMATTVEVGASKYSLSSYGIQTSADYTEKGLLHIYGDTADSVYSANEDKLMKALKEDPDTVMNVLSGIAKNLYESMNDKMSTIPNVRSALTFYNDKTMATQQMGYTKQIGILEEKLTEMEDKYYAQFAAMETAMAKMQSQSSALSSMLGTSSSQ